MNQLTLGDRDSYLLQIQSEIKNKKILLINKKKNLEKKEKLNDFLSDVKNDYNKYYDFILKEKQQQYDALNLLKEYMEDLVHTDNLVDEQLRTAKHEQKEIMSEIDKVKSELDELVK
jgi:hypothetical protein